MVMLKVDSKSSIMGQFWSPTSPLPEVMVELDIKKGTDLSIRTIRSCISIFKVIMTFPDPLHSPAAVVELPF
jgi:hypothetical protein